MARQTEALHHLHVRKRIHLKHEVFPSKNKWKAGLDRIIYVVGIAGPLITIPQVLKVWTEKSAQGISLITWIGYSINSAVWLTYGITYKEKPIIVNYAIWLIMNLLVLGGTLVYQ